MKYILIILSLFIIAFMILIRKEGMALKDIYSKEDLIKLGLHDIEINKVNVFNHPKPVQNFNIIERLRTAKKIILK